MLVARENEKRTLLDLCRQWLAKADNDEDARRAQELILYLEAYTEQSLVVPAVATEGPMKISLNPMYEGFQRSIAKRFLKSVIGVSKWFVPSKDEYGGIVFEAQLPQDIQYAVLSFLSLSDMM